MTAAQAAVAQSTTLRHGCFSVAATVSRRAADRLPAALWGPKLFRRQRTAGRNGRSAAVFVCSTPGTSTEPQCARVRANTSRQGAVVWAGRHAVPRRRHASTRWWCGRIASGSRARDRIPFRTRCQRVTMTRVSACNARPTRQAVPPRSVTATDPRLRWAQQSCRRTRGRAAAAGARPSRRRGSRGAVGRGAPPGPPAWPPRGSPSARRRVYPSRPTMQGSQVRRAGGRGAGSSRRRAARSTPAR